MSSEEENIILDHFLENSDSDMNLLLSSEEDELSATSTDSSDDDVLLINERRIATKMKNYVENIIPTFDDKQFQQHFRLSRRTCDFCIGKLTEANILPTHTFGRPKINNEKAFMMTLWYLCNRESFRQISDRFDVTCSSAYKVIRSITKYLVSVSQQYIYWPNERNAQEIEENFAKNKFTGVIGAIDGAHIGIKRPKKDSIVYCNRKGQYSILLQGVCDDKKRFIDVFCGEAGSMHDARVLKRSSLYRKCVSGNFLKGRYLLGDSAYPNLSWLVTPFKDMGNLTNNKKNFNYLHSASRIVIENAFGLLKGRFRRLLNGFENNYIKFVVECVVAACVLHNICINMDDLNVEFEPIDEQEDVLPYDDNINNDEFCINNKRDELFHHMFNQ